MQRSEPEPLLLDDIEPAIDKLTDVGKFVVAPIARSLRQTVYLFAAAHGWRVVQHKPFAEWAASQVSDGTSWIILDPLLAEALLGPRVIAVRFTRSAWTDGWRLDTPLTSEAQTFVSGRTLGVLDDSAFSGLTFRHASELIDRANGSAVRFAACASTDTARSAVESLAHGSTLATFLDGNYNTVNVRDVCSGLPFAGHGNRERPFIPTDSGPVAVSLPVTCFSGGPWGRLAMDSNLAYSLRVARRELACRFTEALGRPARVEDVPLLGSHIRLPLLPGQPADATTLLETILR